MVPSGSTSIWNGAGGATPWPRHFEIDLHQHRGAADAHGRDRRIDLHVAVFGGGAGDEGDGALHQAEQRRIARPVGVVDHFVQHHLRIRARGRTRVPSMKVMPSVESDPAWTTSPLLTLSPMVQDDRYAVADRGRGAGQLGDVADDLCGAGAAVGLRELDVAGQRVDDLAGEVSAVGRRQRGRFSPLK